MSTREMYQRRWQRAAHRALGEFLAVDGMPAITWTIATSGALVGDVDLLATTPEKQRATFDAWAKQVNAKVTPERVTSDGVAHLYAQFAWSKDYEVRGAIRAEIYPPMDEDGDL